MHNNPLISILIVAYNPGKYFRNTLRSCLDQTYENTEILILDNNSSEDIAGLMVGWFDGLIETSNQSQYQSIKLSNHKTIKLYQSEKNLGPYGGLNYLLEKAQGSYVAIQDHDDIWKADKIEKQIDFLESHSEYVGCGTQTVMYYEGDGKYFEYFLGETNYYTIHPSLIFRYDGNFRYDTQVEYMCDAHSIKNNLCHGEKKIYNIRESLTLHLIKKGSTNYSYKWHKISGKTIQQVYRLHSFIYASLTFLWEIKRKLIYPILEDIGVTRWIDRIERMPFRIFGNTIKTTQGDEWWREYVD